MNWKWQGRKSTWPNLTYFPDIHLRGLSKSTNSLREVDITAYIWTLHFPNTS
jgi:hypothetical protein